MFPFTDSIQLPSGFQCQTEEVFSSVWPLLTEERKAKIIRTVENRCFQNVLVLENIYDRGNMSAVIRSCEALGFALVHHIELGEKFKESQRTTAGSDKWIEMKKWKSSQDCIQELRKQGKKIIVTHLAEDSIPISNVDFSIPSALVLGNEKEGVSQAMIEAADHRVILPMTGFVQSYNISVAGALSLYQMYQSRLAKLGKSGDLDQKQKEILKAIYALRTLDSSEEVIQNQRTRKKI